MTEYIDREAAIAAIMSEPPDAHYPHWYADKIKSIPAADVAPVRHGRWEGDDCSCCKLPWNYNMLQNAQDWGYFDPMPDYCPNCGAKMDLEV